MIMISVARGIRCDTAAVVPGRTRGVRQLPDFRRRRVTSANETLPDTVESLPGRSHGA
jgi:hypothetical protein